MRIEACLVCALDLVSKLLPTIQVGIYLGLVIEKETDHQVDVRQAERGILLYDRFRSHSLAESGDDRIEGNASAPNPGHAIRVNTKRHCLSLDKKRHAMPPSRNKLVSVLSSPRAASEESASGTLQHGKGMPSILQR
jgi:hypothetical protein